MDWGVWELSLSRFPGLTQAPALQLGSNGLAAQVHVKAAEGAGPVEPLLQGALLQVCWVAGCLAGLGVVGSPMGLGVQGMAGLCSELVKIRSMWRTATQSQTSPIYLWWRSS